MTTATHTATQAPTHQGNDIAHYVRRMNGYISTAEFVTIRKAYGIAPSTVLAMLDDICNFRVTVEQALPFLTQIAAR